MTNFRRILFLASIALTTTLAGCGSDDDGSPDTDDTETEVQGKALYRDAATDHAGQPQTASAPPVQDARLSIEVRGTGTLDGLEPQCTVEGASGQFTGVYSGDLSLGDDGAFADILASTAASFATPSGCEIPTVTLATMTEVVVRAELDATTQNCDTFCQAHGRAEAEAECGATADAATCRAESEAEITASCTTTCVAETHSIVAEAALSADALARLNAADLTGNALGELDIDLVFDRVADAEGTVVIGASN